MRVTSEIYLLERVLRVGAAMVTSELRYGGAYLAKTYRLPAASGFGNEYVARASQHVAMVGSI